MENKFKHTPGPWKIFYPENSDCGLGIDTANSNASIVVMDTEAGIYSAETREEDLANAKLIAAAPDLLDALQKLTKQVQKDCSIGSDPKYLELCEVVQESMQVLKKATE
jgi:hypothetical protein